MYAISKNVDNKNFSLKSEEKCHVQPLPGKQYSYDKKCIGRDKNFVLIKFQMKGLKWLSLTTKQNKHLPAALAAVLKQIPPKLFFLASAWSLALPAPAK